MGFGLERRSDRNGGRRTVRNTAAGYLAARGWRVDIRTTEEAFAAHGFEVPNDEPASFGEDSGYLTATLE